ncbi:MAG: methyltransferase domain-containing protein [bacterium]
MKDDQIATDRQPCQLCDGTLALRYSGHPGYVANRKYDIMVCEKCGTAMAFPLETDSHIYEQIYEHGTQISGYDRYFQHAANVLTADNPLDYLAGAEDVYWGVREYLKVKAATQKSVLRILDIGCGLGYLTYALRRAGYCATGLDVSSKAVIAARQRYGDFFICEDVDRYRVVGAGQYDVIIMCEVVEHVATPRDIFKASLELLAPDGQLIVTTPNRSFYDSGVLWETDPPPVHLWWFSEEGVRGLGAKLGCSVSFADFSLFSRKKLSLCRYRFPRNLPSRSSVFDQHYALLMPSSAIQRSHMSRLIEAVFGCRILKYVRMMKALLQGEHVITGSRRTVMCAILSPNVRGEVKQG